MLEETDSFSLLLISFNVFFFCFSRNFKLTSLRGELKESSGAETNPSYFDTDHALAFDFPASLERLERPARRLFRRKRIYFDPSILPL